MYSVAFIFEPGKYDDSFHELNDFIQNFAESMDGFVGKESWQSPDGKIINSTYYWKSEEAIKEFSSHPKHIEAKRQYSKWYNGYHIVVSKIQRSYGDNIISHMTPNERFKSV
ncbi:MAG: heme-degrading monooxygenase HmoA [Cellvibrionaceae bacterium]|jgi:heme-degrading monooxygenase HmoA